MTMHTEKYIFWVWDSYKLPWKHYCQMYIQLNTSVLSIRFNSIEQKTWFLCTSSWNIYLMTFEIFNADAEIYYLLGLMQEYQKVFWLFCFLVRNFNSFCCSFYYFDWPENCHHHGYSRHHANKEWLIFPITILNLGTMLILANMSIQEGRVNEPK